MMKKFFAMFLAWLLFLSSTAGAVTNEATSLDDALPRKVTIDFTKINTITYASYSNKKTALEEFTAPVDGAELTTAQAAARAASIVKNANAETDYQKAKAVYAWVADNMFYNYFAYTSTIGHLDPNPGDYLDGVCADYAKVTAALLRSLGIPCRIVSGYATGGGSSENDVTIKEYKKYLSHKDTTKFLSNMTTNHDWNFAYIDGRWVFMDTTWGSNNYLSVSTGKWVKRPRTDKYFDMSLKNYSKSHCAKKLDTAFLSLTLDARTIKHSISKDGSETKIRISAIKPAVPNWSITNTIRWYSDNEKVVVLDNMWEYTPKTVVTVNIVGKGTATVTCIVGAKKAQCKVTVVK